MGPLRQADLHATLDVVAELGDVSDVGAFRVGALAGVRRLIRSDAVAYNEIDVRAGAAIALVDPPELMVAGGEEALGRYGAQNPLVAHAAREPHTRALKISDFAGRREFHRTDIYDCLFRPAGLEYQMACGLPASRALVVGISLNRCTREFSERDRALLDLLRPHLVQAHNRAAARELSRTTVTALEAALDAGGRAAIVLASGGTIQAASPHARRVLEEYFDPAPHQDALPRALAAWREHHRATGSLSDEHTLEIQRGDRRVSIHVIHDPGADREVLIFDERSLPSGYQLRELGLTARQAEVLACVAEGRSDGEIARELYISEHTVGKHLEHIFERLNVTSRTAAAAAWYATR